jgi:hypothetical protein
VSREKIRPYFVWKLSQSPLAEIERSFVTCPWRSLEAGKHSCRTRETAASEIFGSPGFPVFLGAARLFRQRAADESTRADSSLKVSFGEELCIGIQERNPRNAQFGRQRSSGGYLLAGT